MSGKISYVLLLLSIAAFLAAFLLIPLVDPRFILSAILLLLAGFLLSKSLSRNARTSPQTLLAATNTTAGPDPGGRENMFALGKLFEATLSGMREGLLVVDRDMRVVASNSAAHKLFKFDEAGSESQRLTELTRNPAIYNAFREALNGQERSGVKVETYSSDRGIFDLRVVPLSNAEGRVPQGAIGVFFDITKLERLERVRQEFLSNVSHELRTPLTAILAFIETLESGAMAEPENNQRFLEIIRKNATRMHTLIDDILELSAIEAGHVTVEARQIELVSLVDEVITSLTAKAAARGIVVENRVQAGEFVCADSRRLEQMLTNLIDNAIKFNRDAGKVIVRHEKDFCSRIIIQDTGDGIPSQHLERLFERFYRIDKARSKELGGTGLGLAIVKHLARAHGGEVRVQSRLGEGSTFEIILPLPKGASAG
ncbi:MAG TPA: ATP-binding protein [Pyrinomonadaceae bacterium]|nr:ATP-binding protein [Pyrinomonadaceae bacterium]